MLVQVKCKRRLEAAAVVSYSEVVRHTLGRPGQLLVELLLIMSQMGRWLTPASLTTCCALGLQSVAAALSPWATVWQLYNALRGLEPQQAAIYSGNNQMSCPCQVLVQYSHPREA